MIAGRPDTQARVAQVNALRMEGLRLSAIARTTGISPSTLYRWKARGLLPKLVDPRQMNLFGQEAP
jgi:predicted DNA-binding transcriptional regulator AlpA